MVEEKLPFAEKTIWRMMRQNLDGRSIKKSVTDNMNKLLYRILKDICNEMDKQPYSLIEQGMFDDASFAYKNVRQINEERKALLARCDAICADVELMKNDIRHNLKLHETDEDDFDVP